MLTLREALTKLRGKPDDKITLKYLENLAKEVSVADMFAKPSATTYIYSGGKARETYIKPNLDNTNIRTIDNTYIGKFLDHDDYTDAVVQAYVNMGNKVPGAEKLANTYTRGTGTTGPWAEASKRFAADTKGKTKIFLDNPKSDRVWWQTEMPTLINNADVTTINGVKRQDLLKIYNEASDSKKFGVISDLIIKIPADNKNAQYLDKVILHYNSNNKIIEVDISPISGGNALNPEKSVFAASLGEMKKYASDADLRKAFGTEFDNFKDVQKNQARQLEFFVRKIVASDGVTSLDDALVRYLAATGKKADQLNAVDDVVIKMGRMLAKNSPDLTDIIRLVLKYDDVFKAVRHLIMHGMNLCDMYRVKWYTLCPSYCTT